MKKNSIYKKDKLMLEIKVKIKNEAANKFFTQTKEKSAVTSDLFD